MEACDPWDDCYRRMTLVRVAANRAGAMAALVAAGRGVRAAGEAITVLPFTHVRQQIHRIPTAPSLAELLHDAAATREWAAAGRQATFALTVRRTPMDATGALTGAGHTTHLLELRRTTWAGAGPLASGHGCTHAFTGAVTELWPWPRTDDAALPGAAPRLLNAADADHGFHGGALGAPLLKQQVEFGPKCAWQRPGDAARLVALRGHRCRGSPAHCGPGRAAGDSCNAAAMGTNSPARG